VSLLLDVQGTFTCNKRISDPSFNQPEETTSSSFGGVGWSTCD